MIMFRYIIKRLFGAVITVFMVITITFFLVHLTPGDPFSSERAINAEALKSLHHMYKLDLPLWDQYCYYIKSLIFDFDFGISYKNIGVKINDLIFPGDGDSGFWLTMKIGIISFLFISICGISLGIISALKPNGILDNIISTLSTILMAVPTLILAPLLILVFSVYLSLFPVGQWEFNFSHLFLPVISMSFHSVCILSQIQKNSLIDVLNSSFIRTARAKGLTQSYIIKHHALRPALIPTISYLGPNVAAIFAGAVITEKIFSLPGIGTLTVNAAMNRDYSMILALTILFSIVLIVCNTIVDISYAFIDPKVRDSIK